MMEGSRQTRVSRPYKISESSKYIFGDFSPDEFNQFFVTPRSSVELPPYNGTVQQATDELPEGQEYQRIEFGVNEVIEPNDTLQRTPNYSISSTLNPQAPEFILSCTTSTKTPEDIDKEGNYSSIDCQYPGSALALDGSSNTDVEVLENDGTSGGLGQRERKKKKKRPPGYYSYLKDGSEGSISREALVNGHANPAVLNSVGTEDVELMGDMPLLGTPRTCSSPQDSTDFGSEAVPGGSFPGALDSNGRTAGQPEGYQGPDFDQSCLLAEADGDSLLRTAVAHPYIGTDTTENLGVTNGQILESLGEGSAANGVELHTVESVDLDPAKAESAPPPADASASVAGTTPVSQPKSWASLFHDSKSSSFSPVASVETKYSPPATSPLVSEKQAEVKEGLVPVSEDPVAIKIAELLENVTLIHKPVSLQPRGLINKGNWCYINATLQALVACPPMYHLMKFIPLYSKVQRPCTSTPMIDSFVRLMNEFTNMPVPPKPRQALGDKIVRDIRPGAAFEPTYIYRLLTVIKSSLSEKGRQEDAEEYLGFILNGLHEEMLNLKKLLSPNNEKLTISNGPKSHSVSEEEQEEAGEGSEDEWEQVGPRNKTSVTRQADFVQTPITGIFGGHIRSVVYQQSSKESATLQPFFTLQLDIQSDKIRTVQDALESLVARESVQGYTTKTKQEVEISRRVTLEKLPPVLVLHLKRFVYEKTGGCQKLIKNIEYPVDLEISKELLSPGVKNKNFKCYRTYRLFAVVYHHGSSATGGHYTTDVFQIGLNGWLRIDDQAVKVINQYQVLKPTADRTAYLLYYRRVDLL
ncbi:ubiquitin carboxyl-terminal hydrolase 10 isoform X1 [Saccopteryx bilineata]|uniref:ubiquitin carboxyl-terminal hydrolase 10 isoform X1 n=1 Tax=Saccopteryx bilineata TaxID=59482 RepID=UPI00338F6B85